MESNEIYDEGDVITNLQTQLNEVFRPKTSLEIKGDKLIWIEKIGDNEQISEIDLVKIKK